MTEEMFFDELERLHKQHPEYTVRPDMRVIRLDGPDGSIFCPITFVAYGVDGAYYPAHQFAKAAKALGLDPYFAEDIVAAADKPELYEYTNEVQRRLESILRPNPESQTRSQRR